MTTDDTERQDSIARALGWDSYDAAPEQVQRNIDSKVDGPFVPDPFAPLERRGDD